MRTFIRCSVSIAVATRALWAQAPTTACEAKLAAPATDSQVVQLNIRVAAFDTAVHLTPSRQSLIGQGIRQSITMPRALSLNVYTSMNKDAWPTLTAIFRTTLHRDGRFTDTRVVGGTRNRAFDDAMIAAIVALDTAGLLGPPDSASIGTAESMDLRIVVAPGSAWSTTNTRFLPPTNEGSTPLVRLRLPIRGASGPAMLEPNNPHPVYPYELRQAKIQGETRFEFVVDADGKPDIATVQVVRATAPQFVRSVLDVLPRLRFLPLHVEGCPVASLVQLPFAFSLSGVP